MLQSIRFHFHLEIRKMICGEMASVSGIEGPRIPCNDEGLIRFYNTEVKVQMQGSLACIKCELLLSMELVELFEQFQINAGQEVGEEVAKRMV